MPANHAWAIALLLSILAACSPAARDFAPESPSPESSAACTTSTACGGTRRFAYVSTHEAGVLCYTVDPVSGALTRLDASPCISDGVFTWAAEHPSGRFLYVTNALVGGVASYTYNRTDEIRAFAINRVDGSLAAIPGSRLPAGWNPVAVTVDPRGRFVYMANHDTRTSSRPVRSTRARAD
jgi:6-phosphogluconolactonase (cycloisomerase 2 family)